MALHGVINGRVNERSRAGWLRRPNPFLTSGAGARAGPAPGQKHTSGPFEGLTHWLNGVWEREKDERKRKKEKRTKEKGFHAGRIL